MFSQMKPYLCALVSLYLMCCLAHDIWDYHKLQTEDSVQLKREQRTKQETLSRLRTLIQLEEKEDINSQNRRRWTELSNRLKKIED